MYLSVIYYNTILFEVLYIHLYKCLNTHQFCGNNVNNKYLIYLLLGGEVLYLWWVVENMILIIISL